MSFLKNALFLSSCLQTASYVTFRLFRVQPAVDSDNTKHFLTNQEEVIVITKSGYNKQ